MLDTRSNASVLYMPDEFHRRMHVRSRPSFGVGSLRSHKKLLGVSAVLFLAVALFYTTYRATTYTASGQLLVYIRQILTGADLAILPGRADLPLVQNQIELLRSGNVLTQVVDALQLNNDPEFSGNLQSVSEPPRRNLSNSPLRTSHDPASYAATLEAVKRRLNVRQVGTSHMISVSLKASDPERAARIVNSVIRIYLRELVRASDAVSSRAPALRELYQSLGPSAQLISAAEPPVRADGPPAILILIVATFLGLGIGAAAAILLDAMNDTIRSPRQMEYALGLECLGIIRRRESIDLAGKAAMPQSLPERQTFQRLAAAILDPSFRGYRSIGVTSTRPGEGATTVAVGIAQTLAASGRRVLLIDGVSEAPSVSHWAANSPRRTAKSDGMPCPDALAGLIEVHTGLHVLPLGERPGRHSIPMHPAWIDEILSSATDLYDLVIVDMPSLVAGPDVRAAAGSLDGFLLVVRWGATESELVRQGFQSSGEARIKFVGAVLNMADETAMKRYGYAGLAELKIATVL